VIGVERSGHCEERAGGKENDGTAHCVWDVLSALRAVTSVVRSSTPCIERATSVYEEGVVIIVVEPLLPSAASCIVCLTLLSKVGEFYVQ